MKTTSPEEGDAATVAEQEVGYLELIRGNRDFRNLWLADIISLLGDWFNTIALYTLVEALTGSPAALGLVFITKMATFAVASPLAGVVTDRYDRRRLMIGADLLRFVVVLGFLLVDSRSDLWLLYTLISAQIALGSVFRPARSASLPNITRPAELMTANALMAATWSSLLALGAALGGFAAAWFGLRAVFLIDACTYLVSAFFLLRCRIPQPSRPTTRDPLLRAAWRENIEGWRYLKTHPGVARFAVAKSVWASGGAALVYMLALVGAEMSGASDAAGASVAIGLLFAARGLGTGVGPILARAVFKDRAKWPRILGRCVFASGVIFAGVGLIPWGFGILFFIILAHALSGANWVMSAVLLQERAEDRFRGRVFATEWLLLTATNVVAISTASALLEYDVLTLREAIVCFSAVTALAGLAYLAMITLVERAERSP